MYEFFKKHLEILKNLSYLTGIVILISTGIFNYYTMNNLRTMQIADLYSKIQVSDNRIVKIEDEMSTMRLNNAILQDKLDGIKDDLVDIKHQLNSISRKQ
jgi:hypothetical protein